MNPHSKDGFSALIAIIIICLVILAAGAYYFTQGDDSLHAITNAALVPNPTSTAAFVLASTSVWSSRMCDYFPQDIVETELGYKVKKGNDTQKTNSCTYYKADGSVAASLTIPYLASNMNQINTLYSNLGNGATDIHGIGERAVVLQSSPTTILFTSGKATGLVRVGSNEISAVSIDIAKDLTEEILDILPR